MIIECNVGRLPSDSIYTCYRCTSNIAKSVLVHTVLVLKSLNMYLMYLHTNIWLVG